MKVFILGGTGEIGSAVSVQLVRAGHQVTGLARSGDSADRLRQFGVTPLRGELGQPDHWAQALSDADAVIHTAATFDEDMARTDHAVLRALLAEGRQRAMPDRLRVLYTGGCWLYGATGNDIADESSRKRPIPPFSWMLEHARQLAQNSGLSLAVVHPAMVYHAEGGGAFARYLRDARAGEPIEIWGSLKTRWPLIHREDLARGYLALLDRPDLTGEFNFSAETGITAQTIVTEISRRTGHDGGYLLRNLKHVLFKHGDLAEGPTLDQQMSAQKAHRVLGWCPSFPRFQDAAF